MGAADASVSGQNDHFSKIFGSAGSPLYLSKTNSSSASAENFPSKHENAFPSDAQTFARDSRGASADSATGIIALFLR